jgi:hypothetical protein
MASLVDRFCPHVHDAPITAAVHDPSSGTTATADAEGRVAVQRPGESAPGLIFQPGGAIHGALALVRGGSLVAVGDDEGTVGVYRTQDGEAVFQEQREGARGRVRAMRGLSISPEGSQLAAIAKDGLLRVWSLQREDKNAWSGFSGNTVAFCPRGQRVLTLDGQGQPTLFELSTVEAMAMDRLQTPAQQACFSVCGSMVIASGLSGIALLRVEDGALLASFATQGGSGIQGVVLSPDGAQVGAVTERSVHIFSLPDLQPTDSFTHHAPAPTGAAMWTARGACVAGGDGLLHRGEGPGLGPVTSVGGFGTMRLSVHHDRIGVWKDRARLGEIHASSPIREAHVDRNGTLVLAVPHRGPLEVHDLQQGKKIFTGGPETQDAVEVAIGGSVVAAHLKGGGCRWWDLSANRGFELPWPQGMALSHGGTWLAAITPKGKLQILDPATGEKAIPNPTPLAKQPVVKVAFVNRRPDMLVLDAEGILGHYDLGASVRSGQPAQGRDILSIQAEVDRLWGITGGQLCALRLPEGDRCSILFIDVHACEVISEVNDLHPGAVVDAENGLIIEPARASALLEREQSGKERRVLRALIGGEWISFSSRGILDASDDASAMLG